VLFRLLRALFSNMFKSRTESKIKKSKYENVEDAKYTEIKTEDTKEKLKNNGEQ
jgi:hypothetical protein